MSYKTRLKNIIFRSSDSSNSTEKDKQVSIRGNTSSQIHENSIYNISSKDDINSEFDINPEKKVTISEYMSNKIEDPDTAIENLRKELEKNLAKYNK